MVYKLIRELVDSKEALALGNIAPGTSPSLNPQTKDFIKETVLCKSLSGIDVSLLTITSRA